MRCPNGPQREHLPAAPSSFSAPSLRTLAAPASLLCRPAGALSAGAEFYSQKKEITVWRFESNGFWPMRVLFLLLAARSGAGVVASELLQRREWLRGVALGLSRGRGHYAVGARGGARGSCS